MKLPYKWNGGSQAKGGMIEAKNMTMTNNGYDDKKYLLSATVAAPVA